MRGGAVPAHLSPEQAEGAASMIAEARVSGIADADVAEVLGWPCWLVTLIAELVLRSERDEEGDA